MRVMSRARSGWVQSCPKHDPGQADGLQAAAGGGDASEGEFGPGAHRPTSTSGHRPSGRTGTGFHGTVAGKNEFADEGPHDLPRRHPCPDDTNIGSSPESAVDVTARHSR